MRGRQPGPSRRIRKIASRMKFLISQVIDRDLHDPRIGFVTVLDVEPTADLKEAKVYLSILGSAAVRSKAEHALADARGYIQKEVGRGLETRNTPVLRFIFDDSQDRASRIEALIQKASQEDRETTMAKKPSKKPEKASRGGEKSAKKPFRKSPLEDKDSDNGEDEGESDAGEEGDADFESDFNEKDDEKSGEVGGEDDFDEDVLDEEDEDQDEDLDEGDDFEEEDEEDEEEEGDNDGFGQEEEAEEYDDDR